MKVLHLPFGYAPDPPGGTEAYVRGLCAALRARGVECAVAAPATGEPGRYEVDGVSVHRFGFDPTDDPRALHGPGCARAVREAMEVVRAEGADVVHLHAYTRAVSPALAHAARAAGIRVVFTYHTPQATCGRGSLLEWGRTPCDGRMDPARCAACVLHARGLSAGASRVVARTPAAVGAAIGAAGARGRVWTALRMAELTRHHARMFRRLVEAADAVVVLARWSEAVMRANGVPAGKVVVSRPALARGLPAAPPPPRAAGAPLRVCFVGRVDRVKGLAGLVAAVRAAPGAPLRLDVYAAAAPGAEALEAELRAAAAPDPRIRFAGPLPPERVVETIAEYDLLAVPSEVLETGPLVVLEAFAAGVPVLGSDLGGIAELVRAGTDGVLAAPGSLAAWRGALERLAGDPAEVARLRAGVRPPRTMAAAAAEMEALYRRLTGSAAARALPEEAAR